MRMSRTRLVAALGVVLLVPAAATAADVDPAEGDDAPSAAWQVAVRDDLVADEYRITWREPVAPDDDGGAWQAPNRGQGMRCRFTPDGVRLVPRAPGEPDWSLAISLAALGRGAVTVSLEPARLFPDENRIRFDHGPLDEWFVNGEAGLKHGFVIHAPPGGRIADGRDAPLHLDLEIDGTLQPRLAGDRRSVSFVGEAGLGVVYYDGLEVRDATDRRLDAWMAVDRVAERWRVRLLVDDRDALYPIEIDPLATTAAWTEELDAQDSWFGYSVGRAGDVDGDGYDDVIVGAFRYDGGLENEGGAFLYLGSATGPSATYDWHVEGDEAVAFGGQAVAGAGDVNGDGYDDVIVGFPLLNDGRGAKVYHGSPSGPSTVADWEPIGPGGSFGQALGPAGDVNGDGYDDVIVGAPRASSAGHVQDGRAYVYLGSAAGLSTIPVWSVDGGQDNAALGIAVATAGDVNGDGYDDVVVGAYQYDDNRPDEGRAYLFLGSASGPSAVADWSFDDDESGACLGGSVAGPGDVNGDGYDDVLIGAAYWQCFNYPASPVGRVYGFYGSAAGLPAAPDWTVELTQTGSMFGNSIAAAGDVNDDGYMDVIVGAPFYDDDQVDEGAAYLYLGSASGLSAGHAWTVEGDQEDARYGEGVSAAGDVNGDGADDLVVGAYAYDNGEDGEGQVYLYLGTANPVDAGSVDGLLVDKADDGRIALDWAASCVAGDQDYAVYEGELGDYASHEPIGSPECTTGGATSATVSPSPGSRYYLVVPLSSNREGSYGADSSGAPRPQGRSACRVQAVGPC